jgi:hypothetical protein
MPSPDALARQLAAGRVGAAAAFLAAPIPALRLLGVDTATAARVSWLTRMMAIRDGALGVGALLAGHRGGDPAPWLLGGAVSDAVDAVVIAGALKRGRVKGVLPTAVVPLAAVVAGVGALTAARLGKR